LKTRIPGWSRSSTESQQRCRTWVFKKPRRSSPRLLQMIQSAAQTHAA
jgi:hypothetical protein